MIEQEIKLRFDTHEAARQAVITAGGRLVRSERPLDDRYLDTADDHLGNERCALRIRREPGVTTLTFKGPIEAGPVKSREEIETTVADADIAEALFGKLGYTEWWRILKHREDYLIGDVKVFIDRTPVGVFVEIEATPDEIAVTAGLLGRGPRDYILDSYRALYIQR
ncbi:MAG: class IV adenylate cyclase [Acidobacteriota bacterium]